ncbi:hypothetical protein Q7P37_003740 [Cladosporium fusiforme]
MNQTISAAYTPLESLLLFQALRAHGLASTSFQQISDELQAIPLVTKDKSYDPARLGPDALKALYLSLLKEEVKRDLNKVFEENKHHATINGDTSPGSRKRKAPSPNLPTIRDAAQHAHLIPQLVMRLYARYRENAVQDIRLIEREHSDVLAKAAADTAVAQQTGATSTQPEATQQSSTATAQDEAATQQNLAQAKPSSNASPSPAPVSNDPNAQARSQGHTKRYSQAKIDAVINHGPEPADNNASHRRISSNTPLPPLSEMAPQSPRFGMPPKYHANHGVQPSPPTGHQSPFPPHQQHQASSTVSSPRIQDATNRASASPRPVLPPPPGVKIAQQAGSHPGSPNMHHGPPPNLPPQQQYQQQQAPYSPQPRYQQGLATPTGDRQQRPYVQQQQQHPAAAPGYYTQQPYQDRRTPYQNPPPGHPNHVYPGQPPHSGGYMLPPFQVTPQEPAKTPHQQALAQQQATRAPQTPYNGRQPPYPYSQPTVPATAPRLQPPQNRQLLSDILMKLGTPPQPVRQRLWKSERKPAPPSFKPPGSPTRPDKDIEPLSPERPRPVSPVRQARSSQGQMPEPTEPASVQPKRGVRKSNRQARESSVTSSAMEGSIRATRSQSVSSIPASEDRPMSRRRIKNEPSTPADGPQDIEDSDRLSVPGHTKRTRRGTITQSTSSSKRKRQQSQEAEDEATPEPTPRKSTITAVRNFNKVSSTIINDISSHKHGSRFAAPVRDREAGGYSEIIKKPRDLKSIRAAITAGTRATSAAAATSHGEDSPTGTPARAVDNSSMTVELERSADLIPPKAIVNGAQLEREVMHMLANAVMFNPGEDGMVADTREMFEDVEARIRDWRGAERDVATNSHADDGEDEGKKKRRKV